MRLPENGMCTGAALERNGQVAPVAKRVSRTQKGVGMLGKYRGIRLGAGLVLLVGIQTAVAAGYRDYQDTLPAVLDGLERSGEPEGVNTESGGEQWSSLQQDYANEAGDGATVNIITGTKTSAYRQFRQMTEIHMETPENLVKSVEVSGYQGVIDLKKTRQRGTVALFLGPETLVVIEADPVASEQELVSLAGDVPLGEIEARTR